MKMKEFGPPGGCASLVPPLDLPIRYQMWCPFQCKIKERGRALVMAIALNTSTLKSNSRRTEFQSITSKNLRKTLLTSIHWRTLCPLRNQVITTIP